ncbi:MAG: Rrf2 family transcriptional regulator [Desulfobacterium sp.]|nr:Rrf2 family transcriptional regulator [Desulfobacterium sp.]
MSASSKLSNTVKALCFLAKHHPVPQNSARISTDTGINASKLRRHLSALAKQGILKTIQGSSGGFVLEKEPSELHLQEIYCALEDRKAFHMDVSTNPDNTVAETTIVNDYFLDLFSEIQVEIEDKMKKIKLSHIINHISDTKELK